MIISFIVLSFNYCKPEEFMVPTTYQGCKSGQGLSLAISLGYCEHGLYLTFAEKKRKVEPKRTKLLQEAVQFFPLTNCIYTCQLKHLGHFSLVRTDWPGLIPITMKISLLIKTTQPEQSNPTYK